MHIGHASLVSPWNHNQHPRLEHNALPSFLWIYNLSFHSNVCHLSSVFDGHSNLNAPYFHSVTSSIISEDSHHTSDIDISTKHHTSTIHLPNIHPIPFTRPTFLPGPTRTNHPVPLHTGATPLSQDPQQSGQKPIFVVFEVLGGLLALGLLLGLGRCCYQYKKAPKRDRIAEFLSRYSLELELANERRPSPNHTLPEPAPAYYPAPPSYEVTSSPGTNYTDMGTHNLPSSSSSQPSILIPPRPAG